MPVFDTKALLPLFNTRHSRHAEAKHRFESAGKVILHPNVISEFTTIIRRNASDAGFNGNMHARAALLSLLREPRVVIESEMDYLAVADLYVAVPGLSFTDAVVAFSSRHFDKQEPITYHARARRAGTMSKQERTARRKDMESRLPRV